MRFVAVGSILLSLGIFVSCQNGTGGYETVQETAPLKEETSDRTVPTEITSFTESNLSKLIPVCEKAFDWDQNYSEVESKYILGEFESTYRVCKSSKFDSTVSLEIKEFHSSDRALANMESHNSLIDGQYIDEWNFALKDSLWGKLIKYRAFTYLPVSTELDDVRLELEANVAQYNVNMTSIVSMDEGPNKIIPRFELMRTAVGKIISQLNSHASVESQTCEQLDDTVFKGEVDNLNTPDRSEIYVLLVQDSCVLSGGIFIDQPLSASMVIEGSIEGQSLHFVSHSLDHTLPDQIKFSGIVAGEITEEAPYLTGTFSSDNNLKSGSWNAEPHMKFRWPLEGLYWVAYEFFTEQKKHELDFLASNEILIGKLSGLMRYSGDQLLNFDLHPLDSWPFCIDTYMTLHNITIAETQLSAADAGSSVTRAADSLRQMQFNYETIATSIDPRSDEKKMLLKSQCDDFATDLFQYPE